MTIFLNDLDGTDGFSLSTQEPGDRSGFDVSSAGDINGDGLADFLVGAFAAKANFASNPGNGRQVGAAYVVYGRAQNDRSEVDLKSLDGTDGFKIDSGLDQDSLGLSVSGAGDFKGDGLDDIVIRSFGPRANVVFGGANESAASFSTSALNGANGFNYDLETVGRDILHKARSAGDINNDGFDDIVVNTGLGGKDFGAAVLFGSDQPFSQFEDLGGRDASEGFLLKGAQSYDQLGASIDSGDINGDGFDDIIVSANNASPAGDYDTSFHAGSTFIIFGQATPFTQTVELADSDGSDGFRIDGSGKREYSGSHALVMGDINGDGLDEIVFISGSDNGQIAIILFGKAGVSNQH